MTDEIEVDSFEIFCNAIPIVLQEYSELIENERTEDFLLAICHWLRDSKGGKEFFQSTTKNSVTWNDVLSMVKAGLIYE